MAFGFRSLRKSDLAWHLELGGDAREWLYLDGATESGYAYSLLLARKMENAEEIVGPDKAHLPLVELRIMTPQGVLHHAVSAFPIEEFRPEEPWGVRIGQNTLQGSLTADGQPAGYHVKVSLGDIGIDVTAKAAVVGMRFVLDDHGYMYYDPGSNMAVGDWPLIPRGDFKGNLTVQGQRIPVTGMGYCERQAGNVPFAAWISHWFFGHFYAGEYTAQWADQACTELMQYRHFRPLVLWKGSDVILSTHNLAFCAEHFELDSEIRMPYPTAETLCAAEGSTVLTALIRSGRIMERDLNTNWAGTSAERPGCYFRQVSDVEVEIMRCDKVEQVRGKSIHEFGWLVPWFPVPGR